MGPRTRLIAGATRKRPGPNRPVNPPVERATTLLMPDAATMRDPSRAPLYGISGTATHDALRAALADLEGAAYVALAPSGLAALTLAVLSVVRAGDEVLAVDCLYGPTRRFLDRFLKRLDVSVRYFHPRATPEDALAGTGDRLRLLILESPGSHTFEMQDVADFAGAARARGADVMVDNSWAAGVLFRPLEHGATLSVQALTKYAAGASDVFMGSVAVSEPEAARRLENAADDLGAFVSADDVYLVLRGLRTLPLRLQAHAQSAQKVAEHLQARPEVRRVFYPALPSSPDHALWRRDFTGANGLMGVELEPASDDEVHGLLNRLELFGLGFSWGGYESLITHETVQLADRRTPHGVEGPLIRLHVGLEDVEDLVPDLSRALDAYPSRRGTAP